MGVHSYNIWFSFSHDFILLCWVSGCQPRSLEQLSQLNIKKCAGQRPHRQRIREEEENGFVVPLCIALTTLMHQLSHRRSLASGKSQPTLSLSTLLKRNVMESLFRWPLFEGFENTNMVFSSPIHKTVIEAQRWINQTCVTDVQQ